MAPKRRKTQTGDQGKTSNHLPSKKQTDGETLNPSSQKEIGEEETLNSPSSRDIGGGETSNPPTGGREEIGVTIDPHILECSICFEPLCRPVYQCRMGHVACFPCWDELHHQCPTCGDSVRYRNIAFESVLDSIHIPCPNANLGCREPISYSDREMHTDKCQFALSLCPIPLCAQKAFPGQWQSHFVKDHWHHDYDYSDVNNHREYGESYTIIFDDIEEDRYYTYLGCGKDVFLLVKEAIQNVGNVLTLYYIDLPDLGQNYFECELRVVGGPYRTSLLQ